MGKTKLVPPDGSYGWVIVLAFGINYLIVLPIVQGFGLIFKDKFRESEFSATDISLIVNTNAACSSWFGLINGALLKKLGYRKVATIGAVLMSGGMFMMAYANTFSEFIIIYGIITAIGMGMELSSYPLALNTYFIKNRNKAFGYAMTLAAFGSVLMPQLISILLRTYGTKGAIMVLSAVVANAFVGACLLQPVRRHMKYEIAEVDLNEVENEGLLDKGNHETKIKSSGQSLEEEVRRESACKIDAHLSGSALSLYQVSRERSHSISSRKSQLAECRISRTLSVNEESNSLHDNTDTKTNENKYETKCQVLKVNGELNIEKEKNNSTSLAIRIGNYFVNLFDLTLLKDLTFVNIIVGIALGVFAEKNFNVLIPFILQEYDLNTQDIATFMSMHSVADIFFRFITPYVNNLFNKPVRVMYLWALSFLILFRFCLLAINNYIALLTCAVLIGFARGFRAIYWILIVPSYVPIERLPSASGLQYITTGMCVFIGAPILGLVKDLTNSFKMCIFVMNSMTFLSILMWTAEFTYKHYKSKNKAIDLADVK